MRTTRDSSASNLAQVRHVHQGLLEKALHMRCVSYLADAKAQLLIRTVSTVGESKRSVSSDNLSLRESLTSLKREIDVRRQLERQLLERTCSRVHFSMR